MSLSAREHISVDGDIISENGNVSLTADTDFLGLGDITTMGTIDAEGDVDITGRNVTVARVNAGNDMTLKGLQDVGFGGGTVEAKELLTAGGDIEIMVKATPGPDADEKFYESDDSNTIDVFSTFTVKKIRSILEAENSCP